MKQIYQISNYIKNTFHISIYTESTNYIKF